MYCLWKNFPENHHHYYYDDDDTILGKFPKLHLNIMVKLILLFDRQIMEIKFYNEYQSLSFSMQKKNEWYQRMKWICKFPEMCIWLFHISNDDVWKLKNFPFVRKVWHFSMFFPFWICLFSKKTCQLFAFCLSDNLFFLYIFSVCFVYQYLPYIIFHYGHSPFNNSRFFRG